MFAHSSPGWASQRLSGQDNHGRTPLGVGSARGLGLPHGT